MWTPANIADFPSSKDKVAAHIAISFVEAQLKDALVELEKAQHRVQKLEDELCARRAWIAPVRRLSADVLSLIFEYCGKDNWKTSLRIAAVSQWWRIIILDIPVSWSFIDLRECNDHATVQLFFERSGERPLHTILPRTTPFTFIDNVLHRIQCLTINMLPQYPDSIFSNLKRLTIEDESYFGSLRVSDINSTRFPCLTHLACGAPFLEGSTHIMYNFPPLELLSCTIIEGLSWLMVLRGCKETLTSLELHFNGTDIVGAAEAIELPKLKRLEIRCWDGQDYAWPLQLKTPVLESYAEFQDEVFHYRPLHTDIGQVTHLRTNQPIPSLSAFQRLQFLEMFRPPDSLTPLLLELSADNSLCPELRSIELPISREGHHDFDIVNINKARTQTLTIDCGCSRKTSPSIVISECGVNFPCYGSEVIVREDDEDSDEEDSP